MNDDNIGTYHASVACGLSLLAKKQNCRRSWQVGTLRGPVMCRMHVVEPSLLTTIDFSISLRWALGYSGYFKILLVADNAVMIWTEQRSERRNRRVPKKLQFSVIARCWNNWSPTIQVNITVTYCVLMCTKTIPHCVPYITVYWYQLGYNKL
jgi:hypothetical protein